MMSRESLFFRGATSSGSGKSNCALERVINPPLQTSKGIDHDNSGNETSPESLESNFRINSWYFLSSSTFFLGLAVKFADHSISRVRNNCTENTSKITWSESNAELSSFVVIFFSLGENVIVEILHKPLESDELDDSVGDLSAP